MVSKYPLSENPRKQRRVAFAVTAVALVIVYILWNTPALEFLVYPLRLFVTFVHEAGHSLAAIISGGRVLQFVVSSDGSGFAVTSGGTRALVIAAGYLGAAFFGSVLFYVINRFHHTTRGVAVGMGLGMVIFTVMFAAPDDQTGLPIALIIGIGFGSLLAVCGAKFNNGINLLVLNVLAVMTALNAVLDIWSLTRFIDATRGTISNDAVAFSREVTPLLPPALIALIWAGLAILMLGVAIWYGLWKPLSREMNESYESLRER